MRSTVISSVRDLPHTVSSSSFFVDCRDLRPLVASFPLPDLAMRPRSNRTNGMAKLSFREILSFEFAASAASSIGLLGQTVAALACLPEP